MTTTIEVGTVVEYTRDETWGEQAGQTLTGDVVQVGKTYADVAWRHNDRIERIRFRDKATMADLTFTAETPEQVDAARREHVTATFPFLPRQTERRRIEIEHDDRADLIHQGQRTSRWYRTVAATLRARTVEIDRMVAALRPGDRVRQADDPTGAVWTIRETRDGTDGWVWLGLRRTHEDGTEIWTGCRARGVDLVAAATDDEHAAEIQAQLDEDHRHGWITDAEYAAALAHVRSHPGAPMPTRPSRRPTATAPTRRGRQRPLAGRRPRIIWSRSTRAGIRARRA